MTSLIMKLILAAFYLQLLPMITSILESEWLTDENALILPGLKFQQHIFLVRPPQMRFFLPRPG